MKVDPEKLTELTAQFVSMNLPDEIGLDPEEAAQEELETGEPILATFSFLKWLTDEMVQPGKTGWMDVAIKNRGMMEFKALAPVLERLLQAGADRDDLNTLVRIMQYVICTHVCTMVDQVVMEGVVPIQDFGLYVVGGGDGDDPATDKPIARLEALHEQIGAWDRLVLGQ